MSARALLAVALLTLAGCSSQAAATPAPKSTAATTTAAPVIGSVGQPVPFVDQLQQPAARGTVTINSAHRMPAAADDPFAHYGSYLILDVTISVTSGEIPADVTELEAQGKSGHNYTATFPSSEPLGGTARPGVDSRGNVALDAPAADGPYRVVWSYGNMAGSNARAEFSIDG